MGEEVTFAANVKGWVAIKKMGADVNTKPEEVAAILAGITATIDRKGFEFAGIKTEVIDAYVDNLTKGKRKGYGNLAEIFGKLSNSELKAKLIEASDAAKVPVAEAYFLRKVLTNLGYAAWIDGASLMAAYPDLKIPKPRGNFGKKKKQ